MRLVDNVLVMIEATPGNIVYYLAKYQTPFEHYECRVDFCRGMPIADAIKKHLDDLHGAEFFQ